jgi:hypothetical protein
MRTLFEAHGTTAHAAGRAVVPMRGGAVRDKRSSVLSMVTGRRRNGMGVLVAAKGMSLVLGSGSAPAVDARNHVNG